MPNEPERHDLRASDSAATVVNPASMRAATTVISASSTTPASAASLTESPSATTSARVTNRSSAAADARRAQIVAAARDLFEEKGLSRTTVQDIAQRVGVTRTLFYHYFPDKDAVTLAVLDDYVADYVEALVHWNANRTEGDIDDALKSIVRLLRLGLFEHDPFHVALASRENAALYLEFVNRVADHTTKYIIDTTVRDYGALHEIRINHLYETFYVLILGVIGYLRKHPDANDQVIADVIAQTLHIDRP